MTKKIISYSCPCAVGSHKIDTSTKLGRYLHKCITQYGETVRVSIDGIHFHAVPRMYIAFHGLRGTEVKTFPLAVQNNSN